jgi:N6-adenosine-specific RNA methylase IME4
MPRDGAAVFAPAPFGELRAGHYGAIIADPPWHFSAWSEKGRGRCPDGKLSRAASRRNAPERHYKTLTLEEIAQLPISELAAPNCLLLLWAIDPMLPDAIKIGEGWGFTYKTVGFYWAKLRRETSLRGDLHSEPAHKLFPMGNGYWTRANPEICLLFSRGAPKRKSAAVRKLIISPRREHSRKPDDAAARVESLVDGPYLELFARERRSGWDSWGAEVGKFEAAA